VTGVFFSVEHEAVQRMRRISGMKAFILKDQKRLYTTITAKVEGYFAE
jgi:hypothetical protein